MTILLAVLLALAHWSVASVAQAAGEYRLFFGTYYHGVMRMKKKGAQDLEVLIIEPVPVRLTETHTIMKGARRLNAAMLFLEYAASPEG